MELSSVLRPVQTLATTRNIVGPNNVVSWCAMLADVCKRSQHVGSVDEKTFQLSTLFNFIYYLRKEKYKNGRFPQIALASRGGKRQERIGFHYIQLVKFVQSLKKIIEK